MSRAWQAVLLSLAIAIPAAAEEVRYIVVLTSATAPTPDVAALGGRVERRQDEMVIVTLSADAAGRLKADPLVKYTERVGGDDAAEPVLAGAPADPVPGGTTPKRVAVRPLSITSWDSGTYGYDGAGNITSIGTNRYTYDGVQRLKTSATSGTSETYNYDGFGNMTQRTTGNSTQSFTVSTSTNRLASDGTAATYLYDAAGNMTSGGFYTWTYDALGQAKSKQYSGQPAEYYIYTANDERIGVLRSDWWTWSIRDESGKVLRQYRRSNADPTMPALWLEDYVWANGLLLGANRPAALGGRRHFHLDHLGSPRLVTTDDGKAVAQREYLPFGQENTAVNQEGPYAAGFDREEPLEFTGHERDFAGGQGSESAYAVDYMHARYYSASAGRFLSIDPTIAVKRNMQQPQGWNRYVTR